MEGKRLLITGSRTITDRARVFRELDNIAAGETPSCIIHGGALGVDTLAGAWAIERNVASVAVMRPDFKTLPVSERGFKAYAMRDRAMVDSADIVVVLWNGRSPGARLAYKYAEKQHKLHSLVIMK